MHLEGGVSRLILLNLHSMTTQYDSLLLGYYFDATIFCFHLLFVQLYSHSRGYHSNNDFSRWFQRNRRSLSPSATNWLHLQMQMQSPQTKSKTHAVLCRWARGGGSINQNNNRNRDEQNYCAVVSFVVERFGWTAIWHQPKSHKQKRNFIKRKPFNVTSSNEIKSSCEIHNAMAVRLKSLFCRIKIMKMSTIFNPFHLGSCSCPLFPLVLPLFGLRVSRNNRSYILSRWWRWSRSLSESRNVFAK